MSINYSVKIHPFAKRHYIKRFEKKYKSAWKVTQQAIVEELKRADFLLKETSIAENVSESEKMILVKTEFRIAGSKESRHKSGNRCIVIIDKEKKMIDILLVYHKNDLGDGNETRQWKNIIRKNYGEYRGLIKNI